jgi:hypothetical protein
MHYFSELGGGGNRKVLSEGRHLKNNQLAVMARDKRERKASFLVHDKAIAVCRANLPVNFRMSWGQAHCGRAGGGARGR